MTRAGGALRVALTFDAEHPDRVHRPGISEAILDVLAQHDVRSTWFLQGRWVEAHPTTARRVAANGHLIGNHSFYHARLPLLTSAGIRTDVRAAEKAIGDIVGVDPRPWFRCPFGAGAADQRVLGVLAGLGYRDVGQDVTLEDWEPHRTGPAMAADALHMVPAAGDPAVVLFHAWPPGTLDALPPLIDGGNSKADVALLADDGTLLGAVRVPTISHQAVSFAAATDRLRAAVTAVARRAGLKEIAPAAVVACLAGADYRGDLRVLRTMFRTGTGAADALILNDTFAALRAGSSRPWGIALICGQGINGAAVAVDGRRVRFAGVGDIAGDWGGGGGVGMAGLAAAVRGRDGRGPRTALERTIPAAVGLKRPDAVTHAYYTGRLEERRIGDLAPTVFDTAANGDAVARSIVDRLADELAGMAAALARRTGLVRRDPEVVLAGGVFRTDDAAFHGRLAGGVARAIPAARVVRLGSPPVLGAALLGLDGLAPGGATAPDAAARARAGLDAWSATATVEMPS